MWALFVGPVGHVGAISRQHCLGKSKKSNKGEILKLFQGKNISLIGTNSGILSHLFSRLSISQKIIACFSVPIVMTVLLAYLSYIDANELINNSKWILHTEEV